MGRVEELEELLKRATPGPWKVEQGSGPYWRLIYQRENDEGGNEWGLLADRDGFWEPNADLIVAAVNALPDFIELAKAAEDCLRYRPGTRRHKDAEETMRIALARLDGGGK